MSNVCLCLYSTVYTIQLLNGFINKQNVFKDKIKEVICMPHGTNLTKTAENQNKLDHFNQKKC